MAEQETKQAPAGVPEYLAAVKAAGETLEDTTRALRDKYPNRLRYSDEGRKEREAYYAAEDDATKAWNETLNGAWETLGDSSDPLVKWIAENCEDYRDQAQRVLEALPATLQELDALAYDHEWCGTWERFREQAIEAGVMPGTTPMSVAYKTVFEVIGHEACCALDGGGRRRIATALDALLAEAKAEPTAA